MATGKRRGSGGGKRQLNASTNTFVDAVADVILERLRSEVPSQDEFRELRKTVQELLRKSRSRTGGGSGRGVGRPRSDRKCGIDGCSRPHVAQGYCSRHYQAQRREEQVKKAKRKTSRSGTRKKKAGRKAR
jgi:hypothetical protein